MFDGYLERWETPLRFLRHKRPGLYRYLLGRGIEPEDIEQEALIKLANAARAFRPELVINFDTYACKCIMSATTTLRNYVDRKSRRLPEGVAAISIGEDDGGRDIANLIADRRIASQHDDGPGPDEAGKIVEECLDALDDRSRRIIALRYGLDGSGSKTLAEVGEIVGLTRERIRQIEERAFERMRVLRIRQLMQKGAGK